MADADIILSQSEYESLLEEIHRLQARISELTALRDDLIYHVCPALQAEYEEKIANGDAFAAKFFDISIFDADGNKIQPAVPVSVDIELWDEMTVSADADIKTIHFEQDEAGNETPVVINSDVRTSDVDESEKILDGVSFNANGFSVYGFDIAEKVVEMAADLLKKKGYHGQFKAAGVTDTGYPDHAFDAVVSLDVLDHMPLKDAQRAVPELCRITRPGGCVIISVDRPDEEYEREPHTVNGDGDYLYTEGKWKGRVHHPYTPEELGRLTGKSYVMLEDPEERKGQYTLVIRNWES